MEIQTNIWIFLLDETALLVCCQVSMNFANLFSRNDGDDDEAICNFWWFMSTEPPCSGSVSAVYTQLFLSICQRSNTDKRSWSREARGGNSRWRGRWKGEGGRNGKRCFCNQVGILCSVHCLNACWIITLLDFVVNWFFQTV